MVEYTSEVLSKIQKIELEMLLEVDRICRKYDIPYIVEGGTLIGAIRHQGFIPWDDDADIRMMRVDYRRFCEVCKTELDSDRFFLQNYDTDPEYRWGYGKIVRRNTELHRTHQEMLTMKRGIFLDIFPIDSVPDSWLGHKMVNIKSFIARKIAYSPVGAKYERRMLPRLIYKIMSNKPESAFKDRFKKLEDKTGDENTKLVRIMSYGDSGESKGFLRKWMTEREEYSFEGHMIWGPKDYDGFLTFYYGDYMQLPPEEKQVAQSPADYIKFEDGSEYGEKR